AHAIDAAQRPVGIAHQRVRQAELLAETVVDLLRIAGHADHLAPRLAHRLVLAAKLARFARSAGGEGLGEEEEDDGALFEQGVQGGDADLEVGGGGAGGEHLRPPPRAAPRARAGRPPSPAGSRAWSAGRRWAA